MKLPEAERLHVIMAGNGSPYRSLTPLRKRLLRALRQDVSMVSLAEAFGLSIANLEAELAPLVAAHLLRKRQGTYQPAFFIADAAETERITAHALTVGRGLADCLMEHWDSLEAAFQQLTARPQRDFCDLAFLLVGDRILDVGLLDVLASNASLMPPAPARPAPDRPDARYYFWMVEGERDQVGRYGQRAMELPWQPWHLLTFGQYHLAGKPNVDREALEASARAALIEHRVSTPSELARHLNLLAFHRADTRLWAHVATRYAVRLESVYLDNERSLRDAYATLRASRYAPYGFGEFFCWYHHLAYASAIDMLAEAGVMNIPEHRYIAALWYEELPEEGF